MYSYVFDTRKNANCIARSSPTGLHNQITVLHLLICLLRQHIEITGLEDGVAGLVAGYKPIITRLITQLIARWIARGRGACVPASGLQGSASHNMERGCLTISGLGCRKPSGVIVDNRIFFEGNGSGRSARWLRMCGLASQQAS